VLMKFLNEFFFQGSTNGRFRQKRQAATSHHVVKMAYVIDDKDYDA
jgi:hypothetical protein